MHTSMGRFVVIIFFSLIVCVHIYLSIIFYTIQNISEMKTTHLDVQTKAGSMM